ncbi:T9SS type A sorting domain-containing protein [Pontibacter sp. E15-1]|uniref:T9SS type A sorting domain-containing protein n=1 Tax=Pontibacter sp. E15-1 TaxID=2919918 RepID=UPI001F4F1FD0|nr:T9SS type A sorting domain-containing protein [Pontibacter sp. E15-1]MCJ8163930.1 T9SS type A sorting domain-containing protein [Pontibacter sp. E15-1]
MKITLRLGLLLVWMMPILALAEGSKQLTPNTPGSPTTLTDHNNTRAGYLAHDANFPSQTGVSTTSLSFLKPAGYNYNGATYSKDHRLYVRVLPGEQLHYGVHRTAHDQGSGNQGDLIITVRYRKPDGSEVTVGSTTLARNTNSTRHMLLQNGQSGVIEDASQASIGPVYKYGTGGYKSLSVANPAASGEARDYYFEFTQTGENAMSEGQRFSVYDFWDFSVYDGSKVEKPGRLYAKLWSFSAGGTGNVFSKTFNMFPLIPSEDQADKYFVKKLELAGIAPQNFFRFVTNRNGSDTSVGATVEARRKSQNAQKDYPEFNNFVNNPDPAIWPSATAPTFNVSVVTACNTNTGGGKATFNTYSSERSTFLVLVEQNGTAGYQAGTTDVLLELNGPKGNKSVEWNGLDGKGNKVAKGATVTYYFKNAASPIHFPVWDAEMNVGGFRVEDVRPVAGSNYNGELYWDDSNLSTTAFPAPQTELFGVSSSSGAHSWGHPTTNALAGDLKLVNTWTYGYTNSATQSQAFTYDCSADVGVTQTVSAGPYTLAKPLTYTLTVTNNGPVAATGVTVTGLLDAAKLQFISSSDAAAYNSGTGLWTIGALAVGASKTLTITAQPKVLGSITTMATKASNEADDNAANNSAAVTISVVASADIEVKNTVPQTTYNNGDLVPYTITVKNLGPNAATGVAVTDLLPSGLKLEGTVPAGYTATTGVWTVGDLALNGTKSLVLNARVTSQGTITTTAYLNSRDAFQLDENGSNNISSNTITVNPTADVAVASAVSSSTTNQNQVVTFTITATNNGPNNATNVVLANAVPSGLTIVGNSVTAGTFNAANNTWSVGTIPVGGTHTLTLQARATAVGTFGISSSQTHTENDGVPGNDSASSSVTVGPTADVAVTNTIAPVKAAYANGDAVTYTVVVTNNGPSAATSVVVTDKLPASLTFTSASATTGVYTAADGKWTVGNLANGASATLTLNATINQSAVITTTATQTHTEFDNVNGNNSASNSIRSGSGTVTADVKVEVSASAASTYTGQEVSFTTRATNTGPDAATSLSLTALVPAGMTLVSATPKIGTYTAGTGKWDIGKLASGAFTELILVVRPNPDNTVTGDKNYRFTANGLSLAESQGANTNPDEASVDVVVKKAADARASMVVTGDVSGVFYHNITEATFTFTVTNDGPDVLTNLMGQDTRTGTITFTAVPVASGGTTYTTADGLWRIPVLNPGESKTLVIKGIPNTVGRLNLGGQKVSQDQYDPNTQNDKAIVFLKVVPVADLQVTNAVAAGPYYNGQPATFTVQVLNNGPDAATGVTVLDKLPAGLSLVSYTTDAGTYDAATGVWSLGTDLLPGSANKKTLTLTVKPTAAASYTTTASVNTANEYDSNNANNSQSASLQANASADISVASTLQAGPYYIGGKYTVTVTAKNLGPDAATGVALQNMLSAGLKLVAGSEAPEAGTSFDAATGVWTVGGLSLNQTRTLTFQVTPTSSGTQTSTAYKTAGNEHDVNGGNTANGNNTASVSLTPTDRPAALQQLVTGRHYLAFATGEAIATFTDPDGAIENAAIVGGTLPAGTELRPNGTLLVRDKHLLKPGSYSLTIETVDEAGGKTQTVVNFTISQDWDNDGVNDRDDIDDNNDGITDVISGNGVDPLGDADNDGDLNYHDLDFVHPVYGAYRDQNNDGINDVFDLDMDGRINSLDADMDGDGITNVLEANGGKVPAGGIYSANSGTITGAVSGNGMPVAAQTENNSGVTIFAMPDTDEDTFKDFLDLDADNDGILDNVEGQSTAGFINKAQVDTDRDGINDAYDPDNGGKAITPVDTDADGVPDYLDLDSDDDLTPDFEEAFDDDQDGTSLNDMVARAERFEAGMAKGYYTPQDTNKNKTPDWLEKQSNRLAYLSPSSAHYYDSNNDGVVDLLDTNTGGRPAALQKNERNEYSFRDAQTVTPLPVTLVKFAAKSGSQGVLLTWATASEKDSDHFVVERSTDGKNFVVAGTVKSAGNSTTLLHYSLPDAATPAGTVYYRLKQVDENGTFAYSGIIFVSVAHAGKAPEPKAIIYPNPTDGIATLNMGHLPAGRYNVSVIGMDGRTLQQLELNSGIEQRIDVSSLPRGKYVLRIQGTGVWQGISFIRN